MIARVIRHLLKEPLSRMDMFTVGSSVIKASILWSVDGGCSFAFKTLRAIKDFLKNDFLVQLWSLRVLQLLPKKGFMMDWHCFGIFEENVLEGGAA